MTNYTCTLYFFFFPFTLKVIWNITQVLNPWHVVSFHLKVKWYWIVIHPLFPSKATVLFWGGSILHGTSSLKIRLTAELSNTSFQGQSHNAYLRIDLNLLTSVGKGYLHRYDVTRLKLSHLTYHKSKTGDILNRLFFQFLSKSPY